MASQTAGDALRYPELNDPANVPSDMLKLATDTQTGLNARALFSDTGWVATGTSTAVFNVVSGHALAYRVVRIGTIQIVYLRGMVAWGAGNAIDTTIMQIASQYAPTQNQFLGAGVGTGSKKPYDLMVDANGKVAIPGAAYHGGLVAGDLIPVFGSYMRTYS